MIRSDAVVIGVAAVGVAVPLATWLAHVSRRKTTGAPRPQAWLVSHKAGGVFALTNVCGHEVVDVEVTPAGADVEVRPRGAPWRAVADGDTVEFFSGAGSAAPSMITISWTTPDGTRYTAEPALTTPAKDELLR